MAVTQLTEEIVLAALGTVKDPELHRGMIELKMIQDVALVDPRTVAMRVVLTTPACPLKNKIHDDIDAALATLPGRPRPRSSGTLRSPAPVRSRRCSRSRVSRNSCRVAP